MATQFDDLSAEEETQMQEMENADTAEPAEVQADVPEEVADVDVAGDSSEDPKQTSVPYGVLREERDKRQALANELTEAREQMRRMEAAFQKTLDRPQEVDVPDPEDDPDAYNRYQLDQINERQQRLETQAKEQHEREQQGQQAQAFLNKYRQAVETYAEGQPDIKDAYEHVYKARDEELRLTGYTSPAERRKILEYEEEQLVHRAFQAGDNPAERIYELAKVRGYRPQKTDKVETIQRGQKAARSLARTGGAGDPPVTLQRLLEADGADFDKAWSAAQKKGLLG